MPRAQVTAHLGHVVIEKYQIHRIRDENLYSLPPARGSQNLVAARFKEQLLTLQHAQCVIINAENHRPLVISHAPHASASVMQLRRTDCCEWRDSVRYRR
jgi:hypothetical protein